MRRRDLLFGGGSIVLGPPPARAQTPRTTPRIGVLWHAGSAEEERIPLAALTQGLADFGYRDGKNIVVEARFPNEEPAKFTRFAAELAELQVEILVAVTRPAAVAAQGATTKIPIVFIAVPDPVGTGLVDNLAHPGANVTGLSNMALELTVKRVELLKELDGRISRFALLVNVNDPQSAHRYVEVAQPAAAALGLTVEPAEVRGPGDFASAFERMEQRQLQ